jgi:hypothetical protein
MNLVLGVTINPANPTSQIIFAQETLEYSSKCIRKAPARSQKCIQNNDDAWGIVVLEASNKHDERRPAAQWNREVACVECIARAQCARIKLKRAQILYRFQLVELSTKDHSTAT